MEKKKLKINPSYCRTAIALGDSPGLAPTASASAPSCPHSRARIYGLNIRVSKSLMEQKCFALLVQRIRPCSAPWRR